MYYQEMMIKGKLHFRTTPNGQWIEVSSPYGQAVNAMAALDSDDRAKVMARFCHACTNENSSRT